MPVPYWVLGDWDIRNRDGEGMIRVERGKEGKIGEKKGKEGKRRD